MNTSLKSLLKPSSSHFFILDIDSTLVTTHQRNQKILDDWIKKNKTNFPEDCNALMKAEMSLW